MERGSGRGGKGRGGGEEGRGGMTRQIMKQRLWSLELRLVRCKGPARRLTIMSGAKARGAAAVYSRFVSVCPPLRNRRPPTTDHRPPITEHRTANSDSTRQRVLAPHQHQHQHTQLYTTDGQRPLQTYTTCTFPFTRRSFSITNVYFQPYRMNIDLS